MDDSKQIKHYSSTTETELRASLVGLLRSSPIPDDQLLANLGLYLESKDLSRLLFLDSIYRRIVGIQGVVFEFGTRWGQNIAVFSALRGIYEPFNRHRKLVAFDTFAGFPSIHPKDGNSDLMKKGQLALSQDYDRYLESVLSAHERLNPLAHIKKFSLRKGDAVHEIGKYLEENPQTIVALAYFDFDLYEPTKKCLEAIRQRLTKGSVVVFDELNDPDSPGETLALMETFGLRNIHLERPPHASRVSFFIVE